MDLGDILQLLLRVLATMLGAIAIVIAWSVNKGKHAREVSRTFIPFTSMTNRDAVRFYEGSQHQYFLPMYHHFAPTMDRQRSFMRRATLVMEEAR